MQGFQVGIELGTGHGDEISSNQGGATPKPEPEYGYAIGDFVMLDSTPTKYWPRTTDGKMGKEQNPSIGPDRKEGRLHAYPNQVEVEVIKRVPGPRNNPSDFDDATKVVGPRFVVLKNKLAQMHRALIQLMLDEAMKNNYQECYVPHIVNSNSLFGTGQLPKFADDSFKLENEEKYLIPTAEVPLTNLFRDKQLAVDELPVMVTAHTPCYRSEAGSYGKDTRGMIRQHQFEKVELVQIVHPSNSNNALNSLISHASSILDMLEISYRHVELCTGDLGFSASKTIDIEVWLPSQETFREISSCSNFTDFQARRMNIKIKDEKEKILAHTINGSGLAVGRCLVAIMENYFDENKGLIVPEALKKYVNFEFIPLK